VAADPGMSTASRLVGLLDALSSMPAEPSCRVPCIHARLHRLAKKPASKTHDYNQETLGVGIGIGIAIETDSDTDQDPDA
jgi:hypothetical protein